MTYPPLPAIPTVSPELHALGIDLLTVARFWTSVVDTDGHWMWQDRNTSKYGYISVGKKQHLVHRIAWIICGRPLPDGALLENQCGILKCINPDHWQLVSGGQSELRRLQWDRGDREHLRHEQQTARKEQLVKMRKTMTYAQIATHVGMSRQRVHQIING